jgi:RecB family exonuclease
MSGPLFAISYSKAAAYRQCRKRYWFRYLSGLPRPPERPNVPGLIGSAVHQGLRVLTETLEPALGRVEVEVYLRMPAHEMAGPGTEHYERALALYEAGAEVHAAIPSRQRWAERDLSHRSRQGLEISARVDRIDLLASGEWQIIDWKTGADQDEWTDEQLDLAHVAARTAAHIPREAEVTAIAWNLREKLLTPGYAPRTRRLRRSDAAATVAKYAALARELEATAEFPAMPGRACSFCEWRDQCPEAETPAGWSAWEVEAESEADVQ